MGAAEAMLFGGGSGAARVGTKAAALPFSILEDSCFAASLPGAGCTPPDCFA